MIPSSNDLVFRCTWCTVHALPRTRGTQTDRYEVRDTMHHLIATIRWYAAWRTYSLFPEPHTVWEKTCLRELADVLDEYTTMQRETQMKQRRQV